MKNQLDASIIIPTYKREDFLLKTVDSLLGQTNHNFEILVVDNEANAKIEALIHARAKTSAVPLLYVPEPELGFHFALHAGARAARSELLLYTNDDVLFDKNYVQAFVDAFNKHPEMAAAGAPIKLHFAHKPESWLVDLINDQKIFTPYSYMQPYRTFQLSKKGYFFETSMGIRKDILFDVGGFNPELFGDLRVGDGETGLNKKLWEKGALIGYVPDAILYHQVFASRMTMKYLEARFDGEGACDMYALLQEHYREERLDRVPFLMNLLWLNMRAWGAQLLSVKKPGAIIRKVWLQGVRTRAQFRYFQKFFSDAKLRSFVAQERWL